MLANPTPFCVIYIFWRNLCRKSDKDAVGSRRVQRTAGAAVIDAHLLPILSDVMSTEISLDELSHCRRFPWSPRHILELQKRHRTRAKAVSCLIIIRHDIGSVNARRTIQSVSSHYCITPTATHSPLVYCLSSLYRQTGMHRTDINTSRSL